MPIHAAPSYAAVNSYSNHARAVIRSLLYYGYHGHVASSARPVCTWRCAYRTADSVCRATTTDVCASATLQRTSLGCRRWIRATLHFSWNLYDRFITVCLRNAHIARRCLQQQPHFIRLPAVFTRATLCWRGIATDLCLSVCRKPVLSRNGWTNRVGFSILSSTVSSVIRGGSMCAARYF